MNMIKVFTRTLLAGVILAAVATSQAATITWGAVTNISGDSDVSTNGTLVGAVNLDGPAAIINGVTFDALDIHSGPASVGNFSVNGFFFNQFNPGLFTGSADAPFTTLTAGYQSLLGTAAAVGGTMTLTISGLTIGQDYEFQAWVNDSEDADPPGFTYTVDVEAGDLVTLDPNPSLAEGGLGQFVIGTFNANNTSQVITFGSEVAIINGFQLRATTPGTGTPIPEPTTALFGLALVGICGLARRRSAPRV